MQTAGSVGVAAKLQAMARSALEAWCTCTVARALARRDNWRAWQCYDKWNNVAPISAQTMPVLFAESKLTEPVCMRLKPVLLCACSAVYAVQRDSLRCALLNLGRARARAGASNVQRGRIERVPGDRSQGRLHE